MRTDEMGTAHPPKMSHITYSRSEVLREMLAASQSPQSLEARVTESLGSIQTLTNPTQRYRHVFLDDNSPQFTRVAAHFRDSEHDLMIDVLHFEQAAQNSFFAPSCLTRIARLFIQKYASGAPRESDVNRSELKSAEKAAEATAAVCASNLAALQALGLDMGTKLQALAKAQQDVNDAQANFIPLASASIQADADHSRAMIRVATARCRLGMAAQPDPIVGVKRPRESPTGQ
jgi:hypothetical protein